MQRTRSKNKIVQWYKSLPLPPIVRKIVAIFCTLMALALLYKLYVLVSGLFGKDKKPGPDGSGDTENNMKSLDIKQSMLKRPKVFYSSLADGQKAALKGLWVSFDNLYTPLLLLNADELKQVYFDFGTQFDPHRLGSYDLITWYKHRMYLDSEILKLKYIWSKTGLWI